MGRGEGRRLPPPFPVGADPSEEGEPSPVGPLVTPTMNHRASEAPLSNPYPVTLTPPFPKGHSLGHRLTGRCK